MITQLLLDLNDSRNGSNPRSNTGLDSQDVRFTGLDLGIDAITLLWCGEVDVLAITKTLLDIDFDFSAFTERKIGILWNRVYRGSLGCLYAQRDTSAGTCHRLVVTGKALARLPQPLIHRWMSVVRQYQSVRCSRIDIRCDDYGDLIRYEDIKVALESSNYCGFITATCIKNIGSEGWTFNLGSRESEHYMRIYNKEAESGGAKLCRRVESEFKGKKAEYIFDSIAAEDSYTTTTIGKWLIGKFDFIEKTSKNLDRCERLSWWDEFVRSVSDVSCVAVVERVASSVESKMDWIRRQVSKSVALIDKALGESQFAEFLEEIIDYGRSRLRSYEDLLCSEYLVCHNMDVT
jgi:DNA relaxase NicK